MAKDTHLQAQVISYFQSQSSYWKDVYASSGVQSEIYRERMKLVLAWVDGLSLAPDSRILEVGCGVGFLSVALAKRGMRICAVDAAETMVTLAREQARESGVGDLLSVEIADISTLTYDDNSFDLVLAIGVIPWLTDPEVAIREMARVTRPSGHILLTADNRSRLIYLFDPLLNPMLAPLRKGVSKMLSRYNPARFLQQRTIETLYTCHFIDMELARAGLLKVRGQTLGFGPFTIMRHKFLPYFLDVPIHHGLQHLANRNLPIFRATGTQYLVLASKQEF